MIGGIVHEVEEKAVYDNLAAWENPFTDVKSGNWYYGCVAYSMQNGLFSGTATTTFAPTDNMTRGMLWTALYRHAGRTAKTEGAIWYADARKWAVEQGISDGLNPEGDISREQLAAILFRYAKGETTTAEWKSAGWYLIAYVAITVIAAALQGLYKAPIYELFINGWGWGRTGETSADLVTMLINCAVSFWVYFPILKVIFKK